MNSGPSSFSTSTSPSDRSRASTAPAARRSELVGDEAMRGRRLPCRPATSLPTGAPVQRTVPSVASTNASAGASARRAARALISPASAFCAAFCNALASDPPDEASGTKTKPRSWPMPCPSTTTSRVLLISGSSIAFSAQAPHQPAGAVDKAIRPPRLHLLRRITYCSRSSAEPRPTLSVTRSTKSVWRVKRSPSCRALPGWKAILRRSG